MSSLNKYLLKQASADVNVVLIVDEAQNLSTSVIEEIRMLSNMETEKEKLIQIILMGQPELRKKLAMPALEQFRQRVVFHYHIEPLNKEEAREYIIHRLKMAGAVKQDVFTDEAIEEIYKFSSGIPRLINLACHNALISGLAYETRTISKDIVFDAINDLTYGLGAGPQSKAQGTNGSSEADEMIRKMSR